MRKTLVLWSFFVALLFYMLVSCGKEKSSSIKVIDFTPGFKNIDTKMYLSDIAKDINYVILETTSETLIGEISLLKIENDKILIYDKKVNQILLFSTQGKFLKKIGNVGKGPGEYTRVQDIILDEKRNKIIILAYDWTLKEYNLEGEYISQFPIKYPFWMIRVLNDDEIICYLPYPSTILSNGYSLSLLSEQGKEKQLFMQRDVSHANECHVGPGFVNYLYHDTVCIWESYFDTIYGVTGDHKMTPRWTFKHTNEHCSVEQQQLEKCDFENTYGFNQFVETKKYFFFSGYYHRRGLKLLYDKTNGKYHEVVYNHKILNHGFHNDIDGGIPFWPAGAINDTCLYSVVDADRFLSLAENDYNKTIPAKNLEKQQILKQICSQISPMSNPILVLVTIK